MEIHKDIIMRALCHRLSLGGTRHVSIDARSIIRADFDGLIVNGKKVKWSNITPDFVTHNWESVFPIVGNVNCTSIYDAPWLFRMLLEEGAACYTHEYAHTPDIEIKEYIMPNTYKFNIVKYKDSDTHYVISSYDLKWIVREWKLNFLKTRQLTWNATTKEFKRGYVYGLDDITVCWDSHRIDYDVVLDSYNRAKDVLLGGTQ